MAPSTFFYVTLKPVYGHDALRARLGRALLDRRLPQALLFTGPVGSGKQRLALWLAQSVLCEDDAGEPCGHCGACRLVLDLAHPDLHWFVPVARPKSTETTKQIDEIKSAIAEVVAERRETGQWEPSDGTAGHWLASVRMLQRVAAVTPFRARRKILILGDAERLVVQDANLEAANALLKLLEEPPADTTIILTASEPQALLPTIRSRVVPLRVGRLPDATVREFVTRELDARLSGKALEHRVASADGRIGFAVPRPGDDRAVARARALLEAARGGPVRWAGLALAQAPWGARGDFAGTLDALVVELRAEIQQAAGAGDRVRLQAQLAALGRVQAVQETVGTNVNPQLALAELARELEQVA
jgi:DNA polymerase-3 subunit delta'